MSVLALSSVRVQFGADPVLSDVNLTVAQGDRWGVVGRNGTGKTSLFKVITGTLAPEAGHVSRRPGLTMTLLDQHREFGQARTVWEAAAAGYHELVALERDLSGESERIGALGGNVKEADLKHLDHLQETFQHLGGYSYHARVDAVLQGLGFDAEEARGRPLSQLSGGERGRVGLAAQLAAPADLLLLDEPTNHLDLDTIDWLKSHLMEQGRTVMVISHDRAFLDEFAENILHLHHGTATAYQGGYSSFVSQRDLAVATLTKKAEEQQKEVARQEEFIRKNIAGQKTAQAQSRRNRLAKLPRLSPPLSEDDTMAVRFELSGRGGDQVLVLDGLGIELGGRRIVEDFSALARRGDVIAVVGPNGAGKTTLLSTFLGERAPTAGSVTIGAGITHAWYRQDHAHLPTERSIYACVAEARPAWSRGRIQDHLGRFGFSGDEVKRSTDSLSGGERARVALALITLQGSNLLALDEPTNHLDVESIEALEDALSRFPGTVLLVSHDRALLRELSTRVWFLEGGRVTDYPGTFAEWEVKAAERRRAEDAERAERERQARAQQKADQRKATDKRRQRTAPLRAARRRASEAEHRVTELEKTISGLEEELADPGLYDGSTDRSAEARRLTGRLAEVRRELDEAVEEWTAAQEALEAMEADDDPNC